MNQYFDKFSGEQYEVILLVTKRNIPVLEKSIPYIRNNLGAQCIHAIASRSNKDTIEALGIDFIDEDTLLDGLTFSNIKDLILNRKLDTGRTGWYYQQFLKYAFAYKSKYDFYLTWDADTIPLNRINYFDCGKPLFIEKKELHKGYFNTIQKLFCGEIYRHDPNVSFIAENMMFNSAIVSEIIRKIENNESISGKRFYEKIINAINPEDFESGFSEFETYGNYVKLKYPDLYGSLKLRTLRNGSFFVGASPSNEQIEWAKEDFDIMSIEGKELFITKLSQKAWFRKAIRLKTVSKPILKLRSVRRSILGFERLDYD